MKVKIRKATKKDLSKILKLYKSDPYLTGNDNLTYKKAYILEYIIHPVNKLFVAEVDKVIVGVILGQFWKTSKYVYLNELIIDKKYQREGIGTMLYNYLEALAKKQKYKLVYFFSEVSNKNMHKLAKKLKYKKGKNFAFFSKEF